MVFLAFTPLALIGAGIACTIKFPNVKREKYGLSALKNKGFITSVLSITTYNVPFTAFTTFLTIYAIEKFHVSSAIGYSSYIPFFALSFLTRSFMTIRPFNSLKYPHNYCIWARIYDICA